MQMKRLLPYAATSLLLLGACAQTGPATKADAKPVEPAKAAEAPKPSEAPKTAEVTNLFMVFHENGRLYAFGDKANYLLFMATDEVPFTRTRIGAGKDGETIVFGIQKKEADDLSKPSAAERLLDGKAGGVGAFYGEVVRNGRYHVFGEWQDLQDYLSHNEITFTFTEVGTGPKGETIIYALNNKTRNQGRPVALIEAFGALRAK